MYSCNVSIFLIAFVFLGAFIPNNYTESDVQTRIIYIAPDGKAAIDCPVDHCYHLQEVFSNFSHFFDSYTTLVLLPGTYNIYKRVGQLILIKVKNFTLKGLSPNVSIICQPGASFGLAIIRSYCIDISDIHISKCSAKLQLEGSNNTILTAYNKQVMQYLQYNLSSCDTNGNRYPACYTFLASFENKKVTIYQTAILHSKGVGIFSLDNNGLVIAKTLLAYNQINCINFIQLDTTNTTFNMSQSQINYGQVKSSFEFASGLNLFVHLNSKTHNISLTNVTLANNRGTYGNFYMTIIAHSRSRSHEDINVSILITNILSVQSATRKALPGMVIKYTIYLSENIRDSRLILLNSEYCSRYSYLYNPACSPWSSIPWIDFGSQTKHVHILLQSGYFVGSCVIIQNSELSIAKVAWFRFEMNSITISESRCLTALSLLDSKIDDCVQLSNLTIIHSHNNILSVDIWGSTSRLMLTDNISFSSNQGSLSLAKGVIEFEGFILVSSNTAQKYESVFQISDSSKVYFQGEVIFVHNTGRQGGAISAYSSDLYFKGNISFIGNSAGNGGAISLKEGAVINLKQDTHITFTGNTAETFGGAMYVEDAGLGVKRIKCFLRIIYEGDYCYVEFENNTAGVAGAALFGGWIDLCGTKYDIKPSQVLEFKTEKNSVASNPTRVCMCTNSTINKYESEVHIQVFPGQTFEIETVAVGQRFGMIPASVRAETGPNVIDQLQKLQDTNNYCTKLKFTVRSSNRNETMLLSIDGQIIPKWINKSTDIPDEFLQFKILVILKKCPLGFEFNIWQNICSCQPYLDAHGVQCNFTTYKVNRNAQQWIGILNSAKTVVIHQHCPYDFCKPYTLSLNLSTPDEQCSFNRSGLLCGACQPGLSQVLGTSNCKKCSNFWLLLTFVFALVGMLLVAGLVLLDLNISKGTINGLIFYSNIVRANTAIFFPDKRVINSTFLRWFIAWLNLDVGIETCFYDGLDAYMKTWLQFIFPLYVWLLVTVIIVSSKYSKKAASIFGANAVQVLATLFLLSYAKLLRVTITVFQPTHLLDNHTVWHYDGNIVYLGKWHAPLMVVALLFFVLFLLPYTVIIFSIQWLQIFSHYKPFQWVNKLKPFFDAYTGPYKDRHRYWTGLLLLVRINLFIVFSTNTSGDPAINLLAISIVVLCLFAYLAMFGGVYKTRLLNFLEYSSLLNLAIFSIAMVCTVSTDNEPNYTLSQVSVSITLCTTVLVIAYHGLPVVLRVLRLDTKVTAFCRRSNKTDNQLPKTTDKMQQHDVILNPLVTHSVIELKEPLLEY